MSDFNYRGKLPFRVVSSSVNTGYNAELTAAVGNNIEIVDQHLDHYAGLQDSPAQGPFTQRWVGGNQHRHIELNDGTDDITNRPEAFIISGSENKIRVYGPDVNGIDAPRATITRDNVSKSPVNIKNIRGTDKSLGNFSHNYQVVQTSGRDINQSLIQNNLTASGILTTKFVTVPAYYSSSIQSYITSEGDGDPTGDAFGGIINISGDSNTLVVSSDSSDIPSGSAGAVSIFRKNTNSEWVEEVFLTSSGDGNPTADRLGTSLAVNYDGNVVAASYNGDSPVLNAGAVAIFRSSSLGWIQEATLLSGIASNIGFGSRIDINEAGDRIAVGATSYDVPSPFAGGVFVYTSSSIGGWSLEQILTSNTGITTRQLGADVKINFDGTKIAAGGRSQNCIIMFESGSSGWQETAYITGSSSDLQFMGFQLSLNRDFDIMVAGAYISAVDENFDGQGSAVIFTSSSIDGWKEDKILLPPEPGTDFNFGSSVAIDKNGNTIFIASRGYINSVSQTTGAVYIYNNLYGAWKEEALITNNTNFFASGLVSSVKVSGDGSKFYINCVSSSVIEFGRNLIEENSPYSLPEESNNKTVFVERFSAPGGKDESSRGALDRESEQYSPNNSLITRNIKVRQPYYNQLTQHAAQFNSGSTYKLLPATGFADAVSNHAVNRNTINGLPVTSASASYGQMIFTSLLVGEEGNNLTLFIDANPGYYSDSISVTGYSVTISIMDDDPASATGIEAVLNNSANWPDNNQLISAARNSQVSIPSGLLLGFSGGEYSVKPDKYDNFWVQHAIPSTDLRYKWIADSVTDTNILQYQNLYESDELSFNSSSLVVSGTNKQFPVDNIGINSLIKNEKSINLTTNTFNVSSTAGVSASYSEIANSAFQYAPWKQTRTGEHPVARKLNENNIVSIEDVKVFPVNNQMRTVRRANDVINYTEPPVVSKFKPISQTFELKNSNENYNFIFTHANNLFKFSNIDLKDRLGLNSEQQQMHDLLKKYYSDSDIANDIQNPFKKLKAYTYKETLYPRSINAYLAETRGRTQYILTQSGFTRDGYDRQLGTQRVFWRDSIEDRNVRTSNAYDDSPGFYNSMNYHNIDSYSTYVRSTIGEEDTFVINIPPLTPVVTGQIDTFYHEYRQLKNNSYIDSTVNIDNLKNVNNELQFGVLYINVLTSSNGSSKGDIYLTTNVIQNGASGELNSETFLDYFYLNEKNGSITPDNYSQLIRTTPYSTINQYALYEKEKRDNFYSYSNFLSKSFLGELKVVNAPFPKVSYTAFLGGFESGSRVYLRDGDPDDWDKIDNYKFYRTQPTGKILSTLDSGIRYATESYGDKKPWFDSYEEYAADIRSAAKDHSLLSEFRISNHMSYYIKDRDGNFRSKLNNFLENDGSGIVYRSSNTEFGNLNQDYLKSYVITEPSKHLEKISSENSNLTKLDSIKFTISGIKKLLPYNGFYPKDRTIQLANLFNDYMDNNIGGGIVRFVTSSWDDPALNGAEYELELDSDLKLFSKNTVLPYFFAPGILYNTIKSGISVSFPSIILTGNLPLSVTSDTDDGSKYYNLVTLKQTEEVSSSYAERISFLGDGLLNPNHFAFEAIIFPEKAVPVNAEVDQQFKGKQIFSGSANEQIFESVKTILKNKLINIKFDPYARPEHIRANSTKTGLLRYGFGYGMRETVAFAYRKNNNILDPSYSMAMSNFLAEIPRFFLKNGSMNVFRSAEVKDWKTFDQNKKYYFDIRMKKSQKLVMIESYKSNKHVTGSSQIEKTMNGRYFGWPVNKFSGSERTEEVNEIVHNDPAYAPFTPPYFEGEAILRFELSPSKSSYNSLSELKDDITTIDIFPDIADIIDTGSEAYKNKMSIEDCMEIFGYIFNPNADFNPDGSPTSLTSTTEYSKQVWTISPKLETPVLDFSDQPFVANTGSYWVSSGYGRGMWSGYGKIPSGSQGITIELAESFPLQIDLRSRRLVSTNTGSLLDQVGFRPESKKIGQLADKKTISEAVVAIPYVDQPIEGKTVYIDGYNFFAIDPVKFNAQKTQFELNTAVNGNSITRMIRLMKQYILPPNFDFLTYYRNPLQQTIRDSRGAGIDPFVMYIFEFKHDLDQQDLADIWQGVMPKIAITAEKEEISFGHKIGENELFGADFELPNNMRWMIFKVKKKAEWNYYAVTETAKDDDEFRFKFSNSEEAKTPDYSYNWPYDYFSLVELAKVDVSYTYQEKFEPQIVTPVTSVTGST